MNRLTDTDFVEFNNILSNMDTRLMTAVEQGQAQEGVYVDVINLARDLSNCLDKLRGTNLGTIIARRSQPDRRRRTSASLEEKYKRVETRDDYIICGRCEYPICTAKNGLKIHQETEKCRTRYNFKVSGLVANKVNDEIHKNIQKLDCVLHRRNKEKIKKMEEELAEELAEEQLREIEEVVSMTLEDVNITE